MEGSPHEHDPVPAQQAPFDTPRDPDRQHVVLDDPAQAAFWTNVFQISAEDLAEAMAAVGPENGAVRDWLRQQGRLT